MEVMDKPALVVHPHALVGDGSVQVVEPFLHMETLGAYIKRTGVVVPAGPVAVWHNGYRVPDALWRRLIPRAGDQIIIRARVLGGGGGGKILRTVAMIALVIAAPHIAAALNTSLGLGFAAGSIGMGALTAGVMIGGSLLINALLPPPKPTMGQLGTGQKYESSPTYALSGGRNRMRPWEPMTLIFGRHKVVPDLGANYYTEYVGDDQYLNQLFHFGLQAGQISLSDFRIGDTPLSNYQGVQIQASGPDGKLTMFPGNVDTLQGFVLQSGVVNSRTTPQDVTHISVELAAQLFYIRDDGGIDARTSQLRIQYRPVGGAWTDIGMLQDAVYATHYWALYLFGEWDGETVYQYGSTNPADHTDGEVINLIFQDAQGNFRVQRAQWRWTPHPHTLGRPWQGIAPDPLLGYSSQPGVRITGARQEPTRLTVGWSVAPGQYEVRIWKETGDIKTSRESNETAVGQILCYQTDPGNYSGQQRVALRIKATSQLNGAVDEFNAIAHALCPTWNGSAWETKPTRNPAWWFLWFARGKYDPVTGNRVYGAGLSDAQIDIEAIKAWAAWCDAKGLTFDYVLDRKMPSTEVLQLIARAGRASPTWQSGKLGAIWDAADLPVVAMFGPFNIKAGSFRIDYISEGTADEIVLNFINPDRNWQMDEVRVKVPGATTTNNPLQLDFDGCTNPVMAGREANLLAASQVWHRRRVTWETDIEGWVANRGDVVQMSHDLTVWGYSGRLTGRSGNEITLSQSIPTGSGTMMLRDPEGNMRTVTVTGSAGETDTVTITSDMTGFPLPGDPGYESVAALDWAWFFDPLETPGRRFKIASVEPSGDGVKFQAIDDDPGYYASETNPYQYMPPRDGALLGGIVFGMQFAETIINVLADITSVQVSWSLSAAMPVDVVISVNGIARPAVRTNERQLSIQAQTGDQVTVTVTPISGSGRGQPSTQTYVVQGLTAPLPAVVGLTNVFRDGLTTLVWDRVVDIRQPEYEVRIGPSWNDARTVAIVPMPEALAVGNGLYWVAARYAYRGTVIYGPADSLQISGATLVRNVLVSRDEHPTWTGDLGGGAFIHDAQLTLAGDGDILDAPDVLLLSDVLWYGGASTYGTYETADANIIDIGYDTPVRVDFEIDEYAYNFNENVLQYEDVLAVDDILNESNRQHYRVQPQIRHAGEDMVWSDWRDYVPGLIHARYFDVRLVLETDDPMIVPFVTAFTWIVDVPDLIQRAEQVTIPDTGVRITYPKQFHMIPNVQIATYDAIDGDRYVFNNSDATGFDIQLYNGTSPVERQINWISQGY